MTPGWTPLPWDTEFFGVGIGTVPLDGLDAGALADIEASAREAGIECLYGSLDPAESAWSYEVQDHGWRFVDAATMFDLQTSEPAIPRPEGVSVRLGTPDDLPGMAEMLSRLAPWSRFAVDPRFGRGASHRMQQAWIERAALGTDGIHSLVVAEDERGVIAFIGRTAEPDPLVDTVGTTAQGSGAARYLIEDARAWAGDRPLHGGPIAARNVPSLRYVSHCHYRVRWVRYRYHRWLDVPRDGAR